MTQTAPHILPVRVYYEDTDAGGIVYYANYLKFAERGRSEWLRSFGFDHQQVMRDFGLAFAVRSCNTEFLKPARLDDLLHVETILTQMRGASLILTQRILDAESQSERVTLTVKLAVMGQDGRARRLPAALCEKIQN